MITITRPSKGVRSRKRKREIEDRRSESLGGGGFREASEQDGSNGSSEMEENNLQGQHIDPKFGRSIDRDGKRDKPGDGGKFQNPKR